MILLTGYALGIGQITASYTDRIDPVYLQDLTDVVYTFCAFNDRGDDQFFICFLRIHRAEAGISVASDIRTYTADALRCIVRIAYGCTGDLCIVHVGYAQCRSSQIQYLGDRSGIFCLHPDHDCHTHIVCRHDHRS